MSARPSLAHVLPGEVVGGVSSRHRRRHVRLGKDHYLIPSLLKRREKHLANEMGLADACDAANEARPPCQHVRFCVLQAQVFPGTGLRRAFPPISAAPLGRECASEMLFLIRGFNPHDWRVGAYRGREGMQGCRPQPFLLRLWLMQRVSDVLLQGWELVEAKAFQQLFHLLCCAALARLLPNQPVHRRFPNGQGKALQLVEGGYALVGLREPHMLSAKA